MRRAAVAGTARSARRRLRPRGPIRTRCSRPMRARHALLASSSTVLLLPEVVPSGSASRRPAAGVLGGGVSAAAPCADAGGVAGGQSRLLRGAADPGARCDGETSRAAARAAAARPTSLGHRARRVRGARCGFPWRFRPSPRAPRARPEGAPSRGFDGGISTTSPVSATRPETGLWQWVGAVEIELHELDLRYAALRRRDARRERALVASLAESGQQVPVVVVRGEAGPFVLVDGYKRVRALRAVAPRHGGRGGVGAVGARRAAAGAGAAQRRGRQRARAGVVAARAARALRARGRASWRAGSTRVRAG